MRKEKEEGKKKTVLSLKEVKAALWRRGELKWKLRPEQVELYEIIRGAEGLKYTLYISRRWGKSFTCYLMATEDCLQHKEWQIGFIAPTQKMLKRIFEPIHKVIYKDCPKEMRPKWNRDMGAWEFPNGSILYMSGTDDKRYEDLRGMNAHRCYFDEPGIMTDLGYIVSNITQPQTLTTLKARGESVAQVFLGTPAPTPAHDYYRIKEMCRSEGNYVKKVIYDNSSLDDRTIRLYKSEAEKDVNQSWEREYLCEDVVDKENAIIPEFNEQKERELVCQLPRPKHFVLYGAMDPGFSDYTAYLLGYYDFLEARYVVEGEVFERRANTSKVAEMVEKLEGELYPNQKVYIRFSDTDPRIIADLSVLHNLLFSPTRKDNKDAQVNYVRNMVLNNKLYINPRCKNLIRQMRIGVWNEQKTRFARTDQEGHFDLLDALVYLLRNVDIYENPYPHEWEKLNPDNHFIPPHKRQQRSETALHDALIGV